MNKLLREKFKVRSMTTDKALANFLGKRVRYKQECLTPLFIRQHGTICITETFYIREVQVDYTGRPQLRGYFLDDTFGRVIDPKHIETVKEVNYE